MIYGWAALAAASLVQCALVAALWRRRRDVAALEARVTHFADALALLTDTTQAGFSSLADELERARRPRTGGGARGSTARRIARAVSDGRAVRDVAADEQLSESEIRLHLGLSGDRPVEADAADRNSPFHVFRMEKKSWLAPSTSR